MHGRQLTNFFSGRLLYAPQDHRNQPRDTSFPTACFPPRLQSENNHYQLSPVVSSEPQIVHVVAESENPLPVCLRPVRVTRHAVATTVLRCQVRSGADRTRTDDPRLAKPMLSQLSYGPENRHPDGGKRPPQRCDTAGFTPRCQLAALHQWKRTRYPACRFGPRPLFGNQPLLKRTRLQVGARRVELRTSSLSATRSNQLSYAPFSGANAKQYQRHTQGAGEPGNLRNRSL